MLHKCSRNDFHLNAWLVKISKKIADSYNNWLSLPEEVKIFLQKISNKEIRLEHEIHGLERFRKTVERVGIMLIIAALIIAASILSLNENLPQRNGIPIPSLIAVRLH